jgi:hypothetical protein
MKLSHRWRTRSAWVAGEGYWQVVLVLLPVPGGVQSVSREMCQPESEMSNRYGGRMFARRSS